MLIPEEGGSLQRFNELLEEFPKELELEKILFEDESLLWAQRLPVRYRFRSLGVILCLIAATLFIILDIVILSVARTPLGMVIASLPLPLIILPLQYAFHRILGSQIQVITNYSVRDVERIVNRQMNATLSDFQFPPNLDPNVKVDVLPSRYLPLLPELGIDPAEISTPATVPPSPRGEAGKKAVLLWVSSLSFLEAHRSILINALFMEAWVGTILFSPLLVNGKVLEHYLGLVIILMIFIPCAMIFLNFLLRVDVLASSAIAFFSVGIKICGYGPRIQLLDYIEAFPHTCEINKKDGSGIITFDRLAMIKWPAVLVREELIFRQHCLAFSKLNDDSDNGKY